MLQRVRSMLLVLLVLLGQVLEADPGLALLDALELLNDLLLAVATALDDAPESKELLEFDHSVVVDVHLVEELHRANLGESALPVLDGLGLVDFHAAVNVEDGKDFPDLLFAGITEFLSD